MFYGKIEIFDSICKTDGCKKPVHDMHTHCMSCIRMRCDKCGEEKPRCDFCRPCRGKELIEGLVNEGFNEAEARKKVEESPVGYFN